jgi:GNAT superfamily N-acetyltransferase
MSMSGFSIREATAADIPLLLRLIKELADYEKLAHEVVATEEGLRRTLFGSRKVAEAIIGEYQGQPVAFALYFHNFSTFLGKPGLYLEDLYVSPSMRGKGFGRQMLVQLAQIAVERDCGRFEWSVLDWNEPAINFYKNLGARPQDEWTVFRVSGDDLHKLASVSES